MPNNDVARLDVQIRTLVEQIPALSTLGLILLGMLIGAAGYPATRRGA